LVHNFIFDHDHSPSGFIQFIFEQGQGLAKVRR